MPRADIDGEAEAKAAFYLRMRARGILDHRVLRAVELVPRRRFVPERYLDLAARDLALPIGCGQTLLEPWLVARMIVALEVERGHRVLEIGTGTGYATAILSHLGGEILSFERYRSLADAVRERLADLGIDNAAIVWGDGLDVPPGLGAFERIIVHGCLASGLEGLLAHLADDGVLVCARAHDGGQHVVRLSKNAGGIADVALFPSRLRAMVPGVATL